MNQKHNRVSATLWLVLGIKPLAPCLAVLNPSDGHPQASTLKLYNVTSFEIHV